MVNGRIDKYQFEEGYCQAEECVSNKTKDKFTFCYYDQDHLGNIRQVREANGSKGTLIQTMNYYPFGAEFCDNGAKNYTQKHKYNGKEFDNMHGLNSYDYGARQYNPVTARWDRIDRFCEKYYNISPYSYCANNPVDFIDLKGDSISSLGIQEYDQGTKSNMLENLIYEWEIESGLTLFLSENGNIEYHKDGNGKPLIRTYKKNGKTIKTGSKAARKLLVKTINNSETIKFSGGGKCANVPGTNDIGINKAQMDKIWNGASEGLDPRTLGPGMIFMHEILHTRMNGNLQDDLSLNDFATGPVVDYMNEIRRQMNNLGYNFGQRIKYRADPQPNGKSRIIFSGGQYIEF